MPNNKSKSDLLSKHERHAIIDIQKSEETKATLTLMNELSKGRKSGEEKGWLSTDDVRAHFKAKTNEKAIIE